MIKTRYYCVICKDPIEGDAWVSASGDIVHEECREEYLKYKLGYKYDCPKCETTGVIRNYGYLWAFVSECPFCGGVGYLKHKPIPIDWKLGCE